MGKDGDEESCVWKIEKNTKKIISVLDNESNQNIFVKIVYIFQCENNNLSILSEDDIVKKDKNKNSLLLYTCNDNKNKDNDIPKNVVHDISEVDGTNSIETTNKNDGIFEIIDIIK